MATVARYIRAEMIEVLSSDYILLARAKGNSSMRVLFGHALKMHYTNYYNYCTNVSKDINWYVNN